MFSLLFSFCRCFAKQKDVLNIKKTVESDASGTACYISLLSLLNHIFVVIMILQIYDDKSKMDNKNDCRDCCNDNYCPLISDGGNLAIFVIGMYFQFGFYFILLKSVITNKTTTIIIMITTIGEKDMI